MYEKIIKLEILYFICVCFALHCLLFCSIQFYFALCGFLFLSFFSFRFVSPFILCWFILFCFDLPCFHLSCFVVFYFALIWFLWVLFLSSFFTFVFLKFIYILLTFIYLCYFICFRRLELVNGISHKNGVFSSLTNLGTIFDIWFVYSHRLRIFVCCTKGQFYLPPFYFIIVRLLFHMIFNLFLFIVFVGFYLLFLYFTSYWHASLDNKNPTFKQNKSLLILKKLLQVFLRCHKI